MECQLKAGVSEDGMSSIQITVSLLIGQVYLMACQPRQGGGRGRRVGIKEEYTKE